MREWNGNGMGMKVQSATKTPKLVTKRHFLKIKIIIKIKEFYTDQVKTAPSAGAAQGDWDEFWDVLEQLPFQTVWREINKGWNGLWQFQGFFGADGIEGKKKKKSHLGICVTSINPSLIPLQGGFFGEKEGIPTNFRSPKSDFLVS